MRIGVVIKSSWYGLIIPDLLRRSGYEFEESRESVPSNIDILVVNTNLYDASVFGCDIWKQSGLPMTKVIWLVNRNTPPPDGAIEVIPDEGFDTQVEQWFMESLQRCIEA